jgi:PIN domain nuclease of toxin-antitoxin system
VLQSVRMLHCTHAWLWSLIKYQQQQQQQRQVSSSSRVYWQTKP